MSALMSVCGCAAPVVRTVKSQFPDGDDGDLLAAVTEEVKKVTNLHFREF